MIHCFMTSTLSSQQVELLLTILQERFEKNMHRHAGIQWNEVKERLVSVSAQQTNKHKLYSLYLMEETGGEPDVVGVDKASDEFLFFDCSLQSPKDRRSLCYDEQSLESRKNFKPKHSALGMAKEMGIELLTEEEYRYLQSLETVDTKTSSWIKTPESIRKLGGALFADYRYDKVFIYHNGVESYYAARGFRGLLKV
jgi:Protein of unknown function (DUF4256)